MGAPPFSGADEAVTGGWLTFAEPRPLDAAALAMYADAWLPAPFPRLTAPVGAPDDRPDRPLPRAGRGGGRPAGEPVLAIFRSTTSEGGFFEEDGELWSRARRPARPQPPARPAVAMIGYLGLGSNVGDRRANLQAAVDALGRHGVRVLASSSIYDTDPVGEVLDQPSFLNACLRIDTELGPEALLDACKAVERELGRDLEGGVRHGPRPIDVDVLLLGDLVHESRRLRLPHAQATVAAVRAHPAARAGLRPAHARRHAPERPAGGAAGGGGRASRGRSARGPPDGIVPACRGGLRAGVRAPPLRRTRSPSSSEAIAALASVRAAAGSGARAT